MKARVAVAVALPWLTTAACSLLVDDGSYAVGNRDASTTQDGTTPPGDGRAPTGEGSTSDQLAPDVAQGGDSSSGDSSLIHDDGPSDFDGSGPITTCAEAAVAHGTEGCEFWPTVTANGVWSIFDFAVVVANPGTQIATVSVTGPSNTNQSGNVAPGQQVTIYLPWVSQLKGGDSDNCGTAAPFAESQLATAGAFHLTSTAPVTAYQFSAIEYAGQGGPAGKSWATCPGLTACSSGTPIGCYAFSNDASLLLPTTAMTGTYRVTGHEGWTAATLGDFTAITATADGTTVHVTLAAGGTILAGTGVAATAGSNTLTLTMNAGDVAELVGGPADTSDQSGSLVQASAPVQVITGMPCLSVPDTAPACDHVEESNLPAETLGNKYVVAQPTGPLANVVGHVVRFYGNFDGTTLAYDPSAPTGCPATLGAGQVVECGPVTSDFEVQGSNAFAVSVFSQGASVVDPTTAAPNQQGDPDQSMVIPVEQYRTQYAFPAPIDYKDNYAVVTAPPGTTLTLDGTAVTTGASPIGSGAYAVSRILLGTGNAGAHVLTASRPAGLQVMGYGSYTSYMYPGGANLARIAPVPTK